MRDFRGNFGRQFGTEDGKGSRRRKGKKEESERERERASQTETGIIREGGVGQRRE